jgi:hypothetical protein
VKLIRQVCVLHVQRAIMSDVAGTQSAILVPSPRLIEVPLELVTEKHVGMR